MIRSYIYHTQVTEWFIFYWIKVHEHTNSNSESISTSWILVGLFSFRGSWTLNVNITGRTLIIRHCIAHFLQNALNHFETKIQPYHFRKYIVMNMNYERKCMSQRITIKSLKFSNCILLLLFNQASASMSKITTGHILDAELQSFKK